MKTAVILFGALFFAASVLALDPLVVGTFSISYIDRWALQNNYFSDENLQVSFAFVSGSEQQFNSLDSGAYDLANTQGDNVIYRRMNLGRTEYTVLAEYHSSPGHWLLGNSNLGIFTIEDLDGKTMITDSTQSGFITAARQIYKDAGIPLPDSLMIFVGSLITRLSMLVNGQANTTMSTGTQSYITVAKNPQITVLADFHDYLCPYIGGHLVARPEWLSNQANQNKLVRFLKAELKAYEYLVNPSNKQAVISFIMSTETVNSTLANVLYEDTVISADLGVSLYLVPRMRAIINGVNLRTEDLRITRKSCTSLSGELASQTNGWIDVSYLSQAAGQQLGFWNVYGLYYNYPVAPCEL